MFIILKLLKFHNNSHALFLIFTKVMIWKQVLNAMDHKGEHDVQKGNPEVVINEF